MPKKYRMMSASDTKWHFYECMETKDFENAIHYFETLWYHYQRRGILIRNGYKIALKGGRDSLYDKNSGVTIKGVSTPLKLRELQKKE